MADYPASGLRNCTCISAALLSLAASTANASSFALIEQSVSGMGSAYAIGAAGINDASTLFFNPAGMTRLSGTNLSGGLQIVKSSVDIDATAEYNASNPAIAQAGLGGVPIPDNGTGGLTSSTDTGLLAAVPAGYISYQASDRLWYGFAINAHFGLETDYDGNWVGRYHGDNSELLTLDFNPSLAFKINDNASIALGISAMYADGELTNAINGGLLDTLAEARGSDFIPGVSATPCVPTGGAAPCPWDLNAKLEGDDWGFGFNVGLLLEPSENTRIGFHYRSKIELDISGKSTVTHPAFPAPLVQGAKLPITLPPSLSSSIYHAFNDQWAFMADITWTEWSKLQHLDITLADGRQNNVAWLYDDSTRYAIGTEYKHSSNWTLRAGVALDESPVPSDADRSPRVPDAERTWLSFGATYRYSPDITVDLAYAHLFVDDPKLNGVPDGNDPVTFGPAGNTGFHSLSGNYDAAVDIVGVQLNWKWK